MQGIIGTTYLVKLFLVKKINAMTKINNEVKVNTYNVLLYLDALYKPRKLKRMIG